MDDFDSLTSHDLKIAVGEEVTTESLSESDEGEEVNELEEFSLESDTNSDTNNLDETEDNIATLSDLEITPDNEGVESLKKLLEALSNKDVAASMKGMKISINIELGNK